MAIPLNCSWKVHFGQMNAYVQGSWHREIFMRSLIKRSVPFFFTIHWIWFRDTRYKFSNYVKFTLTRRKQIWLIKINFAHIWSIRNYFIRINLTNNIKNCCCIKCFFDVITNLNFIFYLKFLLFLKLICLHLLWKWWNFYSLQNMS